MVTSLWADVTNSTISMVNIPWLTLTLTPWSYVVKLTPFYNVNATTIGTGWDFWWWTAVITDYSFRSVLSSTATANYDNNYVSFTQNFTTTQTSRINDNRWTIEVEFTVTTWWTVIPRFRSEVAWWLVTVKWKSRIEYIKTL